MLLSRGCEVECVVDAGHTIWLQILNFHSEAFQNPVSPHLEVTGPLQMTHPCVDPHKTCFLANSCEFRGLDSRFRLTVNRRVDRI